MTSPSPSSSPSSFIYSDLDYHLIKFSKLVEFCIKEGIRSVAYRDAGIDSDKLAVLAREIYDIEGIQLDPENSCIDYDDEDVYFYLDDYYKQKELIN